jgi:hypothetical protein
VITLLLTVGAVVWLGYLYVVVRVLRAVPRLDRLAPRAPARWPKVSLIVPARNEATELEAALRSKLTVDYPALEVVAIDDRSSDDTGRILDRMAREDARIVPLHVTALPEGWLGKLHAMATGVAAASGEFLLLCDADIHLGRDTLRKVVAFAEEGAIDHVTAVPRVACASLWPHVVLQPMLRLVVSLFRPWAVADPRSTASAGIGAFNLVRRRAYDLTPGFGWLRMEVGDDAALGQMLKLSGARCAIVIGCRDVGLRLPPSFAETARQLEKAAGVGGRSPFFLAVVALGIGLAELAPFLALLFSGTRALAAALCVLALVDAGLLAAWARLPLLPALLTPVGTVLLAALSVRSAVLAARRGGVMWRDTLYTRAQLASGARYQLWPSKSKPNIL